VSRPPLLVLAALLLEAGCGSPGDPLPPSLNIPERIADLRAEQYGDRILVRFTLPELTTDGVALRKLGAVELRAGPAPEGDFDIHRWAARAQAVPVEAAAPGPAKAELPARPWVGREIILGVRTAGPKGRFSEWSNLAVLPVVEPPAPPAGLQAEAAPEGVRLRWAPAERPGLRFRLWRRGPGQQEAERIGETDATEFTDAAAEFGRRWEYWLQAVLRSGDAEAVSPPCAPIAVTPEDRFPPAVPSGLRAVAGADGVELLWDRNQESDLRGYYVWRALEDGPLERLSELLELPSFSDRNVQSGKRYRYAVSAADARGNQSPPSTPVEVIAP
jgi:hypothetical protein